MIDHRTVPGDGLIVMMNGQEDELIDDPADVAATDAEPLRRIGDPMTAEQMRAAGIRWYGDGTEERVTVDRARFERLLAFARAANTWATSGIPDDAMLRRAWFEVSLDDLDPLP